MGMFDFLKVTVTEKSTAPRYDAKVVIDGKQYAVANLGISSVTVSKGSAFKKGQKVNFDISLKDPKESLAFKGSGVVAESGGEAKIAYNLSEQNRMAVARFLARYMISR